MFQHRSSAFDPRLATIAGQLRAIEKELGRLGETAGTRASASAAAVSGQIAEMIGPILNEISNRFRRGQRLAVDEAANFGNEAFRVGTRVGNDALDRIATQARQRPLITLAVAIGIGVLIGAASRRS
jgi:hypothetical protein